MCYVLSVSEETVQSLDARALYSINHYNCCYNDMAIEVCVLHCDVVQSALLIVCAVLAQEEEAPTHATLHPTGAYPGVGL